MTEEKITNDTTFLVTLILIVLILAGWLIFNLVSFHYDLEDVKTQVYELRGQVDSLLKK